MALSPTQHEELLSASTVGGIAGSGRVLPSEPLAASSPLAQDWPRGGALAAAPVAAAAAAFPAEPLTGGSPLWASASPGGANGLAVGPGGETLDVASPGSGGLAGAYLSRSGMGGGRGQAHSVSPRRIPAASAGRSPGGESAGAGGAGAGAGAGSSPGGRIVVHLRQQLDLLEARLVAQMDQKCQGLQASIARSEKMRDAASSRADKKLLDVENSHAKLDRRISQLDALARGSQEEMAEQAKWAESLEKRFFDLRRQLEEDLRQKYSVLDTQLQELQSQWRVMSGTCNDVQRRVTQTTKGLRENMQDMLKRIELLAEGLATQQDCLHALEGNTVSVSVAPEQQLERATAMMEEVGHHNDTRLWKVERQIEDLQQWQSRLEAQGNGEQGWEMRLQQHAHAIVGIKSKLEGREQHYKMFDEIRQDWEGKMESLQLSIADSNKKRLENQEEQEAQHRSAHEAMEELRQAVQENSFALFRPQPAAGFTRLLDRISAVQDLADGALRRAAGTAEAEAEAAAEATALLAAASADDGEAAGGGLSRLHALPQEENLPGRIQELIVDLRGIFPKIQEQKGEMESLRRDVEDLRHIVVGVQSGPRDLQGVALAQKETLWGFFGAIT